MARKLKSRDEEESILAAQAPVDLDFLRNGGGMEVYCRLVLSKSPRVALAGLRALERILCPDVEEFSASPASCVDKELERQCPASAADAVLLLQTSEAAGKWNSLDLFARHFRSHHEALVLPALRCFRAVVASVAALPLDNPHRWRWMAVVLTAGDPLPALLEVLATGIAAEQSGAHRAFKARQALAKSLALQALKEADAPTPGEPGHDPALMSAALGAATEHLLGAAEGSRKSQAPVPPPGPEAVLEAARALRVLCAEVFHPLRQPAHKEGAAENTAREALAASAYGQAIDSARVKLERFQKPQAALAEGAAEAPSTSVSPGAAAEGAVQSRPAHEQDHAQEDDRALDFADADAFLGPQLETEEGADDIEEALLLVSEGSDAVLRHYGQAFLFQPEAPDSGESGGASLASDAAAAAAELAGTAGAVATLLGQASECGRLRTCSAAVVTADGLTLPRPDAEPARCRPDLNGFSRVALALGGAQEDGTVANTDLAGMVAPPHPVRVPALNLLRSEVALQGIPEDDWDLTGMEVLCGLLNYSVLPDAATSTEASWATDTVLAHVSETLESHMSSATDEAVETTPLPALGSERCLLSAPLSAAKASALQRKIRQVGLALLSDTTFGASLSRSWHSTAVLPRLLASLQHLKHQLAQAVLAVKYSRLKAGQARGLAPKSARASPRSASKGRRSPSPTSGKREGKRRSASPRGRSPDRHPDGEHAPEASAELTPQPGDADWSLPDGVCFDDVPGLDRSVEEELLREYQTEPPPSCSKSPADRFLAETCAAIQHGLDAAYRLCCGLQSDESSVRGQQAAAARALSRFQRAAAAASVTGDSAITVLHSGIAQEMAAASAAVSAVESQLPPADSSAKKKKPSSGKEKRKAGVAGDDDEGRDSRADRIARAEAEARHRMEWLRSQYGAWIPEEVLAAAEAADVEEAQRLMSASEEHAQSHSAGSAASEDVSQLAVGMTRMLGGQLPPDGCRPPSLLQGAEDDLRQGAADDSCAERQRGWLLQLMVVASQFAACPYDEKVESVLRAGMGLMRGLLWGGAEVVLDGDGKSIKALQLGAGAFGCGDAFRMAALEEARVLPALFGILRHPMAPLHVRDEAEATLHLLITFCEPAVVDSSLRAREVSMAQGSSPEPPSTDENPGLASRDVSALLSRLQEELQTQSSSASVAQQDLLEVLKQTMARVVPADDPHHPLSRTADEVAPMPALPGEELSPWRVGGAGQVGYRNGSLLPSMAPSLGHFPAAYVAGGSVDPRVLAPHDDVRLAAEGQLPWHAWMAGSSLAAAYGAFQHAKADATPFSPKPRQGGSPLGRWLGAADILALLVADAFSSFVRVLRGGVALGDPVDAAAEGAETPLPSDGLPESVGHALQLMLQRAGGVADEPLEEASGPQAPESGEGDGAESRSLPSPRVSVSLQLLASFARAAHEEGMPADTLLSLANTLYKYSPGSHSLMLRYPDPESLSEHPFPPPADADAVAALDEAATAGKGKKKRPSSMPAAGGAEEVSRDPGVARMSELARDAQLLLAATMGVPLPADPHVLHSRVQDPWVCRMLESSFQGGDVDEVEAEALIRMVLPVLAVPPIASPDPSISFGGPERKGKDKKKDRKKAPGSKSSQQGTDDGEDASAAFDAVARLLRGASGAMVGTVSWAVDTQLRGTRFVFALLQGVASGSTPVQSSAATLAHFLAGAGVTPLLLRAVVGSLTTTKGESSASGAGVATEVPVPAFVPGLAGESASVRGELGSSPSVATGNADAKAELCALSCMALSVLLRLSPVAAAHAGTLASKVVPRLAGEVQAPSLRRVAVLKAWHAIGIPASPHPFIVPQSAGSGFSAFEKSGRSSAAMARNAGLTAVFSPVSLPECALDVLCAMAESDGLHRSVHGKRLTPALQAAGQEALAVVSAQGMPAAADKPSPRSRAEKSPKSRGSKSPKASTADAASPPPQVHSDGVDGAVPSWSPGYAAGRAVVLQVPGLLQTSTNASLIAQRGLRFSCALLATVAAALRVPDAKELLLSMGLERCTEAWWAQVTDLRTALNTLAREAHAGYTRLTEPAGVVDEAAASSMPAWMLDAQAEAIRRQHLRDAKKCQQQAANLLQRSVDTLFPTSVGPWAFSSLASITSGESCEWPAIPAEDFTLGTHNMSTDEDVRGNVKSPRSSRRVPGSRREVSKRASRSPEGKHSGPMLSDAALWGLRLEPSHPVMEEDMDSLWLQGGDFAGSFAPSMVQLTALLPPGVEVDRFVPADGKKSPRSKKLRSPKAADHGSVPPSSGPGVWTAFLPQDDVGDGSGDSDEMDSPALALRKAADAWREVQAAVRGVGALLATASRGDASCPLRQPRHFSLTPTQHAMQSLVQLQVLSCTGSGVDDASASGKLPPWAALQNDTVEASLAAPAVDSGARLHSDSVEGAAKGEAELSALEVAQSHADWGSLTPVEALREASRCGFATDLLELLLVQPLCSPSGAGHLAPLSLACAIAPLDGSVAVGMAHVCQLVVASVGVLWGAAVDQHRSLGSQSVVSDAIAAAVVRSGALVQLVSLLDPLPQPELAKDLPEVLDFDTWQQQVQSSRHVDEQGLEGSSTESTSLDDRAAILAWSAVLANYDEFVRSSQGAHAIAAAEACQPPATGRSAPPQALSLELQSEWQACLRCLVACISMRGVLRAGQWQTSTELVEVDAAEAGAPAKKGKRHSGGGDAEGSLQKRMEPRVLGRQDPAMGPTVKQWSILLNAAQPCARYPTQESLERQATSRPASDQQLLAEAVRTGFQPSIMTPLHAASATGDLWALSVLIGASASNAGASLLHAVSATHSDSMVGEEQTLPDLAPSPALLERLSLRPQKELDSMPACFHPLCGVDVNARDDAGRSPAIVALTHGHVHAALALLACGTDVDSADNAGRPLLKFALLAPDQGAFHAVQGAAEHLPNAQCTPFPLPCWEWGRVPGPDAQKLAQALSRTSSHGTQATTAGNTPDIAASRIQALARGRASRRRRAIVTDQRPDAHHAATKIQAFARGKAARAAPYKFVEHSRLLVNQATARALHSPNAEILPSDARVLISIPLVYAGGFAAALFKFLLHSGADGGCSDARGNRPLHWAISGCSARTRVGSCQVQLTALWSPAQAMKLCQAAVSAHGFGGLDVANCHGETALHACFAAGQPALGAWLLRAGAHPNLCDTRGNLPLHYAALGRGWGSEKQQPLTFTHPGSAPGDSCIAEAVAQHGHQAEAVALLLEAGAKWPIADAVSQKPLQGTSPAEKAESRLHLALDTAFKSVVEPGALTSVPASVPKLLCTRNQAGLTPLHVVVGGSIHDWHSQAAGLPVTRQAAPPISPLSLCGGVDSQRGTAGGQLFASATHSAHALSILTASAVVQERAGDLHVSSELLASSTGAEPPSERCLDLTLGQAAEEAAARASILSLLLSTEDWEQEARPSTCAAANGLTAGHFLALSWYDYLRVLPLQLTETAAKPGRKAMPSLGARKSTDGGSYCAGFIEVPLPPPPGKPANQPTASPCSSAAESKSASPLEVRPARSSSPLDAHIDAVVAAVSGDAANAPAAANPASHPRADALEAGWSSAVYSADAFTHDGDHNVDMEDSKVAQCDEAASSADGTDSSPAKLDTAGEEEHPASSVPPGVSSHSSVSSGDSLSPIPRAVQYFLQDPQQTLPEEHAALLHEAGTLLRAWGQEGAPEQAPPSATPAASDLCEDMQGSPDALWSKPAGSSVHFTQECGPASDSSTQQLGGVVHPASKMWHASYCKMAKLLAGIPAVDALSRLVLPGSQHSEDGPAWPQPGWTALAPLHCALIAKANVPAGLFAVAVDVLQEDSPDCAAWGLLAAGAKCMPWLETPGTPECSKPQSETAAPCIPAVLPFPPALHLATAAQSGLPLRAELLRRMAAEELQFVHCGMERQEQHEKTADSSMALQDLGFGALAHAASRGSIQPPVLKALLNGSSLQTEVPVPSSTAIRAVLVESDSAHEVLPLPPSRWNANLLGVPATVSPGSSQEDALITLLNKFSASWPLKSVSASLGTAAHIAAAIGDVSGLRFFLTAPGFQPESRLGDGLSLANHVNAAVFPGILAEAHTQATTAPGSGWTLLHIAVAFQQKASVVCLLENLAEGDVEWILHARDWHGHTALAYAVASQRLPIVRLLAARMRAEQLWEQCESDGSEAYEAYKGSPLLLAEVLNLHFHELHEQSSADVRGGVSVGSQPAQSEASTAGGPEAGLLSERKTGGIPPGELSLLGLSRGSNQRESPANSLAASEAIVSFLLEASRSAVGVPHLHPCFETGKTRSEWEVAEKK